MIRFFLCIFLVIQSSCTQKKDVQQGIPTTAQEINKAQSDALLEIPLDQLKLGDFVYLIKTQEVYTGQQEPSVSLLEEESINVSDIIDYGDYLEITILKEMIDHIAEGSPHSQIKDVLYVSKNPSPSPSKDPPATIKFYNLKVRKELESKPAKVLEKQPCESEECKLRVQKITYDIVYTEAGQPSQTTSVETWISPDVPYFASILKSCFTTVVSIETARPLVRQCKSVFDYQTIPQN